ncbi:hypothetical protein [Botryobacter ruber]|uniref:hypothetical protein n=1 Tax=Botryobacter ruber TaxID=2171629 RepID=UPI000E0B54D0|nr:hypothetical protein [Botryobacter ruber]
MDLETIITGLVFLALCILPVIYVQRKQKAKKKKLIKEFTSLAQHRQITISQHDFWQPDYAIGIDTVNKKLLYTRKKEGNEQLIVVDLQDLKQCRVNNLYRDANGSRTIDLIELSLVFANAKTPEKKLEFYNREVNLNFNDELLLAQTWENIINSSSAVTAKAKDRYAVNGS